MQTKQDSKLDMQLDRLKHAIKQTKICMKQMNELKMETFLK